MMHQVAAARYASVDEVQLLQLTYGDGSLSMVVLLPAKVDGLESLENSLNTGNLQNRTARDCRLSR